MKTRFSDYRQQWRWEIKTPVPCDEVQALFVDTMMICCVHSFLTEMLHVSEKPVNIKVCVFALNSATPQVKNPKVDGDLLPQGGARILESGADFSG